MRRDVRPAATVRAQTPRRGASGGTPAAPRASVPPSPREKPWVPARPKQYRREVPKGPDELILEIPGTPVSKERPRFNTKTGHAYTPAKTKDAEEVVAWHARIAGARVDRHSLFNVDFVFFCPGNRRRDNDNMQKLIQDALNKIVWWDDSQIRRTSVDVIYGSANPRSVITIRRLDDADLAAMAELDARLGPIEVPHPE